MTLFNHVHIYSGSIVGGMMICQTPATATGPWILIFTALLCQSSAIGPFIFHHANNF